MFCIGIFIAKFECLKRKLKLVTLKLLKTEVKLVRRLNSEEVVTWRLRVKRNKTYSQKKRLIIKLHAWKDYRNGCEIANCLIEVLNVAEK